MGQQGSSFCCSRVWLAIWCWSCLFVWTAPTSCPLHNLPRQWVKERTRKIPWTMEQRLSSTEITAIVQRLPNSKRTPTQESSSSERYVCASSVPIGNKNRCVSMLYWSVFPLVSSHLDLECSHFVFSSFNQNVPLKSWLLIPASTTDHPRWVAQHRSKH